MLIVSQSIIVHANGIVMTTQTFLCLTIVSLITLEISPWQTQKSNNPMALMLEMAFAATSSGYPLLSDDMTPIRLIYLSTFGHSTTDSISSVEMAFAVTSSGFPYIFRWCESIPSNPFMYFRLFHNKWEIRHLIVVSFMVSELAPSRTYIQLTSCVWYLKVCIMMSWLENDRRIINLVCLPVNDGLSS